MASPRAPSDLAHIRDGIHRERRRTGEGGHQGFAPESDEQVELLRVMRRRFERVSAERLVAGSGIENIYRVCTLRGMNAGDISAAVPASQLTTRTL